MAGTLNPDQEVEMSLAAMPNGVAAKFAVNQLAKQLYDVNVAAVMKAAREGGYPVPPGMFAAYEGAMADLHRSAVALAMVAHLQDEVHTPDGTLYVAERTEDGQVILTADGVFADTGRWHDGPDGETVYVERYSAAGREFHGWVDANTRKLVQAG